MEYYAYIQEQGFAIASGVAIYPILSNKYPLTLNRRITTLIDNLRIGTAYRKDLCAELSASNVIAAMRMDAYSPLLEWPHYDTHRH